MFNSTSELTTVAPTDYSNTLNRMLSEAVIKTVTIAVQFVSLPPEKFDEALYLLDTSLNDETIRTALVTQNADAVWLMDMRAGRVGNLEAQPRTDAYQGRWATASG